MRILWLLDAEQPFSQCVNLPWKYIGGYPMEICRVGLLTIGRHGFAKARTAQTDLIEERKQGRSPASAGMGQGQSFVDIC